MTGAVYRNVVSLQVCNLATVARPAAALSGAPTIAREASRADSRHPRRKRGMHSLPASTLSCLQFNDISICSIQTQNHSAYYLGFRAGVTR
jgi:hypothetical protein